MVKPQSGCGGVAPTPRNPSTAATRMVNPRPIVARTMIGEIALGRMCANTIRGAGADPLQRVDKKRDAQTPGLGKDKPREERPICQGQREHRAFERWLQQL